MTFELYFNFENSESISYAFAGVPEIWSRIVRIHSGILLIIVWRVDSRMHLPYPQFGITDQQDDSPIKGKQSYGKKDRSERHGTSWYIRLSNEFIGFQ